MKLYESKNGQKPVAAFIKSLQTSTLAKLRSNFRLLEEFGPNLGMPRTKPIGNGLIELRVRGKEEVRALYIFQSGTTIIILHGFKKKTMAISKRDMKIALERKAEIEKLP